MISVHAYIVKISGTELSNGARDPGSVIAWISASTGQVVQTYDNEDGYLQGMRAQEENATLSSFTTLPFLSMLNSSTVETVRGSENSMTLGQVTMNVTTYHGLESYNAFKDWTVVGVIPSTGVNFVVYCTYISSSSGYQFVFRIISIDDSSL